jgi:hypothetical protein
VKLKTKHAGICLTKNWLLGFYHISRRNGVRFSNTLATSQEMWLIKKPTVPALKLHKLIRPTLENIENTRDQCE